MDDTLKATAHMRSVHALNCRVACLMPPLLVRKYILPLSRQESSYNIRIGTSKSNALSKLAILKDGFLV